MKTLGILVLSLALLGYQLPTSAAEVLQSSRSVGKLKTDQSIDLKQLREQQIPVVRARPSESEDYASSGFAQNQAGVANRHDQIFEIYDADVALVADLDGDGYHHAINVYFDVDVSVGYATVYAKLYLSREGGPWSQYFTTNLFEIHIDDEGDAYEVETELLEGYEPGYYSVLVEIYSLDHAYMVTSEVLDYHYLGKDVMIEDRDWDEPYYYDEVHYSSHGGSMTTLLLFFLIIQVVIAARGALALTPCKKSDDNNKNRPL